MTCWIYKTRTKHILTYAISYHLRPAHTPEWFVYIHVCTCMCLCACVWIYPPTLICSCCSYFKFYSTKMTRAIKFPFSTQKTSSSGEQSVKWQCPQVALKCWVQMSQPLSNPSKKWENRPKVRHVFVLLKCTQTGRKIT